MRYHLYMEQVKRPPNDRGQGRKPLSADAETVTVSLRMTSAQREKLAALGGAAWIREKIVRAKLP
jgi:hypothetical protein